MTRNKSVLVPVLTVMLCCGWERSHAQQPAKVPALTLLRDPLAHDGEVLSVAWSPDGKTLASGMLKGVKLWEAATGKEKVTLRHANWVRATSHVRSVAWSPDGKVLASATSEDGGLIRLWDVATGKEQITLQGQFAEVQSVAWSPDGKVLATGAADTRIRLWDAATGKQQASLEEGRLVNCVAWSPDGKTLATASRNGLKLWEVATGKLLATIKVSAFEDESYCVAWSPDGKMLASAGGDTVVKVWDAATGKEKSTLQGHEDDVRSVAWSPDGKVLATASSDRTVRLWDVATGKEKGRSPWTELATTTTEHRGGLRSVAWSPDGKTLATASSDKTVRLWDVDSSK